MVEDLVSCMKGNRSRNLDLRLNTTCHKEAHKESLWSLGSTQIPLPSWPPGLVISDEMNLEELKQNRLSWRDTGISHNKQKGHRTRCATARS